MIKRILIPLDGSKLAEQALATARILVQKIHATPVLLHVIEKNAPPEVHGERHLQGIPQANAYLENLIKKNPFLKRASVEIHVHEEEVSQLAQSIIDHASDYQVDLIILTRHGEGGWKDKVVGSLVRQVIGHGHLPVLLSNAHPDSEHVCTFDRILLALDGDPEHDVSEKIAADFASQLKSQLLLLTVVPTLSTLSPDQSPASLLLPSATDAMLDISEESSAEYLKNHIRKLEKMGLTVEGDVERGDPVDCILEVAVEKDMDLIVLATHGKAGLEAFFAGSVASKVITDSTIPLLLIPV
jgi:nucleotide-binding universal stress UspA family protein